MVAALTLLMSQGQKGREEPPQIAACCHLPNPNPVYPELAAAPAREVYFPGGAGLGSPIHPHATRCKRQGTLGGWG